MKAFVYPALVVLYLLHNDLWYWDDTRLIAGFPIGLLYHVAYCIVTTLLLLLLIKYAWPARVEVTDDHKP